MRIVMIQMNSTVGDLTSNCDKIKKYMDKARKNKADIAIFPELVVTGYPPQDLLHDFTFVKQNKENLYALIPYTTGLVAIIGFVDYNGKDLYNAAAILQNNKLVSIIHKTLLPTYDVFDETRYFKPAKKTSIRPVQIKSESLKLKLGVEICEDLWDDNYRTKVTDLLVKRGADIIVNISASPYYVGKGSERLKLLKSKAKKSKVPIFYVNLVGGQDELVFDGQSLAVDSAGTLIATGKHFEEDLITVNLNSKKWSASEVDLPSCPIEAEMFDALVLGVHDYFKKTGFERAIVGLSGGIDSSIVACIAVEALGKDNVIGTSMPSRFSTNHSKVDAQTLAKNLGICFVQFPIQEIIEAYNRTLEIPLDEIRRYFNMGKELDDPVASENIQPRIRGNCLMDISNRLKDLRVLVLNTGNKTELALGYCTLYGDMVGGIGVIGDVSKSEIYKLAKYVNDKAGREIIPRNVFEKIPSAELRDGQFDPFDYSIVSPLVDEIVEERKSEQELIEIGYPRKVVEDSYNRFQFAEYKRRQAPPCIKITRKAFGIGWKMPIVNKFRYK